MSNLTVGTLSGMSANGNKVTMSSGHTLYTPGHIIQVVTLENITRSSQGFSDSVPIDVSGMSVSITPKSTSSKILIMARWAGELAGTDRAYNSVFYITRNGTKINVQPDPGAQPTSGLTVPALSYDGADSASTMESASMFTTDSPNSTSALTYNLVFSSTGAGGTIHNNKTASWASQTSSYELGTSSMVLMEIAQ